MLYTNIQEDALALKSAGMIIDDVMHTHDGNPTILYVNLFISLNTVVTAYVLMIDLFCFLV